MIIWIIEVSFYINKDYGISDDIGYSIELMSKPMRVPS